MSAVLSLLLFLLFFSFFTSLMAAEREEVYRQRGTLLDLVLG